MLVVVPAFRPFADRPEDMGDLAITAAQILHVQVWAALAVSSDSTSPLGRAITRLIVEARGSDRRLAGYPDSEIRRLGRRRVRRGC